MNIISQDIYEMYKEEFYLQLVENLKVSNQIFFRENSSYPLLLIYEFYDRYKNNLPLFKEYYKLLVRNCPEKESELSHIYEALTSLKEDQKLLNEEDYIDNITIIEKTESAADKSINNENGVVKIDLTILSKLQEQTNLAQNILSDIFIDDDDTCIKSFNDNVIFKILNKLLSKSEWTKNEVKRICQEYNVMMGSVLEQINDYAYDIFDDVIIEEDEDKIYVNVEYKNKL
jgi:hypothetical protein